MLDIVMHPEVVQPLREEIIAVVGAEGWQKTALYKLRLMDSFLKESQRMTPMATSKSLLPDHAAPLVSNACPQHP